MTKAEKAGRGWFSALTSRNAGRSGNGQPAPDGVATVDAPDTGGSAADGIAEASPGNRGVISAVPGWVRADPDARDIFASTPPAIVSIPRGAVSIPVPEASLPVPEVAENPASEIPIPARSPVSPAATDPALRPAPQPVEADDGGETVRVVRASATVVLTWDDGSVNASSRPTVIGRAPVAIDPSDAVVAVQDSTRSLSKTHLLVVPAQGGAFVTDLHSTNGVLVESGDGSLALTPGVSIYVHAGAVLVMGTRRCRLEEGRA